jgi:hypothetical protein
MLVVSACDRKQKPAGRTFSHCHWAYLQPLQLQRRLSMSSPCCWLHVGYKVGKCSHRLSLLAAN